MILAKFADNTTHIIHEDAIQASREFQNRSTE